MDYIGEHSFDFFYRNKNILIKSQIIGNRIKFTGKITVVFQIADNLNCDCFFGIVSGEHAQLID